MCELMGGKKDTGCLCSMCKNNHALTYEVAPCGVLSTYAVVDECNQPFKQSVAKRRDSFISRKIKSTDHLSDIFLFV